MPILHGGTQAQRPGPWPEWRALIYDYRAFTHVGRPALSLVEFEEEMDKP